MNFQGYAFLQLWLLGIAFPAPNSMWAHWAPKEERGALAGMSISGYVVGDVLSLFLTGIISQYFGWESSFYILGGVSALWIPAWFYYAR